MLIGSTLVEGSTLTEAQAKTVLTGRTLLGHSVSEVRELLNYRGATEWIMKEFEKSPYLSEDLILNFHKQLFQGFAHQGGKYKTSNNFTYRSNGSLFEYLHPAKVRGAIQEWLKTFNREFEGVSKSLLKKNISEEAAHLYYEFQFIHPFQDGNGRIGRLLLAYWLHWKFQFSFKFFFKDKLEHLNSLEKANVGDFSGLQIFFFKRIKVKKS